jgi:hypothetical protein
LNELSEQAVHDGMDISLNSLRYAMRRAEGKHHVALALVDYLQRADAHVVLVETDTANPMS